MVIGSSSRSSRPASPAAHAMSAGPAHTTSSAGQPHRELARRGGTAPPGSGDRRESPPPARQLGAAEGRRYELIGSLEELVDDFDLVGTGAEARNGVDESAGGDTRPRPRRPGELAEQVRRKSATRARAPSRWAHRRRRGRARRRSKANGRSEDTFSRREASRERRGAVRLDETPIRSSSAADAFGYQASTWSSDGGSGADRSIRSSSRCTESPISLAAIPVPMAVPGAGTAPSTGRMPPRRSA